MLKTSLKALAAVAALAAVSPASAATYTYTMTNNDVLTIDNVLNTATFKGATINASMKSADFSKFIGGATPTFTAVLSALDGTRLINGQWLTDNPLNATTTHPQKLIMSGSSVNLWAWWGNPIKGGDYVTTIKNYSAVPEPGMVGLLGASVLGLAFARRRKAVAA
ncbi:PEP-CTERM sorting domain-containing protein [Novosphingobium aerophilum]|uniref:PEP-CTERM sorting domain-containing protein n=1 Tax=Novosphingobium aerophilum TaxID=2839843 RepID=UPI001FD2FEF6|nr:PEP-CTERM sorting domain-containing protein [Novosphingobium aerophilum]